MAVVNGVKLKDSGDRVVINDCKNGSFEPESFAFWRAALVPGAVAIDVGAYTGLYAIAAAQAGCIAIAYEPNPFVCARLRENITANGVSVEVRPVAALDADGTATLYVGHDMTSGGRLMARAGNKEIKIKTARIVETRPVCAMKFDVEGAELQAMRGCEDVLIRCTPLVIAEALTDASRRSLVMFMTRLGYAWQEADKRNLIFTCP